MYHSNMKIFVVLTLLVPLVLGRIPYNFNTELSIEDLKELYSLKALTEKLTELKQPYENPFESSMILKDSDVSFYVYNRQDKTGEKVLLEEAGSITSHSSFKTELKTVFVIHGWHNSIESPIDVLIEAALMNVEDVNIIAVWWDDLASALYPIAQAAVPKVGQKVGQFINTVSTSYGYSLDNFSIVGHSLGAHVGGFAGKQTNGQIASITGFDPAGPLYFEAFEDARLCEDDAQYVMAIHTCAKLLGVNFRVGNADFWPNGGYSQNGCSLDITGTCAHSRSYQYYVESANSARSKDFVARQCDSYSNYENGKCRSNEKVVMGGPIVNTAISGNFYLKTNEESPYAQGDTGL